MICPKCNTEVNDNVPVCPNCKKKLLLECPLCKTLNKKPLCEKCGFIILTKCSECGKPVQTITGKCKCGANSFASAIRPESNTDEYAALTLEFLNLKDLKSIFGEKYSRFKQLIETTLYNFAKSQELRVEVFNKNLYVIRFLKDYTFKGSTANAIKAAIELMNSYVAMNFKLKKAKGLTLDFKITLIKRNVSTPPEGWNSGFNIKLLKNYPKEFQLLNGTQIIADAYTQEILETTHDFSPLNSVLLDGQMVMFYELDVKKYAEIPVDTDEEVVDDLSQGELANLDFYNEEDEDDYDEELNETVGFDELRCDFSVFKSTSLLEELSIKFAANPKRLVSIRGDKRLTPVINHLIDSIKEKGVFEKILYIPCLKSNKYKPYGFFSDLISNIFGINPLLNLDNSQGFAALNSIDNSGILEQLLKLNPIDSTDTVISRHKVYDAIISVMNYLQNTLIVIEDFDDIDETSYEFIKLLFEHMRAFDISYILTVGREFSLHSDMRFLLERYDYTEVELKKVTFDELIEEDKNVYKNLLGTFYGKKLKQLVKGSQLYLEQAISLLKDVGILTTKKNELVVEKFDAVLIPPKIEDLVGRRLKFLQQEEPVAFKIFAVSILIGTKVNINILSNLQIEKLEEELEKLVEHGLIELNEDYIQIYNYNLYSRALNVVVRKEQKNELLKDVLEFVFEKDGVSVSKAQSYKKLEEFSLEFVQWQRLSLVSYSFGDVSAYIFCIMEFLSLLDSQIPEDAEISKEDYRREIYETISDVLYRYTPEKTNNLTEIILDSFEQSIDDLKIISLCNKLLEGCILCGDYLSALDFANKILSRLPKSAIDPASQIYVVGYFLISLIKLEILFGLGKMEECAAHALELLSLIKPNLISVMKPESQSNEEFKELLFNNFIFAILAKIIRLDTDIAEFMEKIKVSMGELPQNFQIFNILKSLFENKQIDKSTSLMSDDKNKLFDFTEIMIGIFSNKYDDYAEFAKEVYKAKLSARKYGYSFLEMFCDALIGQAYLKLGKYRKAEKITRNVLEVAVKNGFATLVHACWYFIIEIYIAQNKLSQASTFAQNALIQLEKDKDTSKFILCLVYIATYKLLILQSKEQDAEHCLQYVKSLASEYNLRINIENIVNDVEKLNQQRLLDAKKKAEENEVKE